LIKAADRTGLPVLHKAIILGEADIAEKIAKEFIEALTVTDHVSETPELPFCLLHLTKKTKKQYMSINSIKGR
jgi:hypothetical protein